MRERERGRERERERDMCGEERLYTRNSKGEKRSCLREEKRGHLRDTTKTVGKVGMLQHRAHRLLVRKKERG